MTLLLALWCAAQDTPSQVIEKLVAAVEKKDLKTLSDLLGESVTENEFKEAEQESGGRLVEALQKRPKLGAVDAKAVEFGVSWAYAVEGGQMRVEIELVKKEGVWKVGDFDVELRKDRKSKGAPGKAKAAPGDVLASFVASVEKKDYAKALEHAPKKVREKYDAAKLEKELGNAEQKLQGQFLEGLKSLPALPDVAEEITDLQVGIAYESKNGRIEAGVDFLKEDGAWVIGDFDVDLRDKEDE
jgi:hypothetical protein